MSDLDSIRNYQPDDVDHLWHWIYAFTGIKVATNKVCRDHSPPMEWLAKQILEIPDQILIMGSRGSGKSFLEAIATHIESRFTPRLGTRILGGSKSQSSQIYEALDQAIMGGEGPGGSDSDQFETLLKESATYANGSTISILSASPKSVRGPHVPRLRLDEVDEIPADLREAAMGMNMAMHGSKASVSMTSTWHRVNGPMGELLEKGRSGAFPCYTTCTFDVLEHCSDERSGPYVGGERGYERCPSCPLKKWCHSERDRNGDIPLAKLANGHYAIDSLIQKAGTVSPGVFGSDYLCNGPRADGLWFSSFDPTKNVSAETATYNRDLPVHLTIDSGVFTGAVAFQVGNTWDGKPRITVFWDYLSENVPAREVAREILAGLDGRHGTRLKITTDSAGGSRNPIGPNVFAEYEQGGLRNMDSWPRGSVADGLAIVESLVGTADGGVSLFIHPTCSKLISAFQNYRRAKRQAQWMDYPEDPQHPSEDMIDALRGGLRSEFPKGLERPSEFRRVSPSRIFH